MEGIPAEQGAPQTFNWKAFADASRFTPEQQYQLDTIAEIASHKNVDFLQISKERMAGRIMNHPDDGGEENPVDEMVMWAYRHALITAEEVRRLQAAIYR